jgi:hypothetical protein
MTTRIRRIAEVNVAAEAAAVVEAVDQDVVSIHQMYKGSLL